MPTPWIHLALAAVCEITFASSMKASDGFRHPGWTLLTVVAVAAGMWFLGLALKALPVSAAYPIWVGVGAIGTVTVGVTFFGESLTPLKAASVLAIVLGVVGLRLATPATDPSPAPAVAAAAHDAPRTDPPRGDERRTAASDRHRD